MELQNKEWNIKKVTGLALVIIGAIGTIFGLYFLGVAVYAYIGGVTHPSADEGSPHGLDGLAFIVSFIVAMVVGAPSILIELLGLKLLKSNSKANKDIADQSQSVIEPEDHRSL